MLPGSEDPASAAGMTGPLHDAQSHALANLTRLAPRGLRELLLEDFDVASEAERRVITIMFADLCGYTALSEDRDPEFIRELINRCFEKMAEAVERFGGMVVHFLGDAVLAAFGVPRAHEDDPERAIQAALEMVAGVEKIGRSVKIDLALAVGIHMGEVVVGGISVGDRLDFTAFGDAVNTASRLQNLAGFGEILVSGRIHAQVQHAFECEPRPPAFVKNKREPIGNFKLVGPKRRRPSQRPRGHGLETTLVGRSRELKRGEETLKRLLDGRGGFLCLVGEPGVGKSRLARELREAATTCKTAWLEAGCVSYGATLPYGPVLDLLRAALEIQDDLPVPALKDHIGRKTRGLKGVRKPTRQALAYLLGDTSSDNPLARLSPKRRKENLIAESVAYFRGLARRRPLVLLLDDLHWADPLSLEWIDALVADSDSLPILVMALYRPLLVHDWPKDSKPLTVQIEELSRSDSRRLLHEILGVAKLPPRIVEPILKRTRGNPFFIEELVHSFRDAGIIEERAGKWEFVREVDPEAIPDTLRGVVLARIDALEVRLRRVLQIAAVIGRGFRYEVLEYVTDFQARLDEYVHQLVDIHFLVEQSLISELLYLFHHAVARDITYQTLLKRRRAEFHRRVGESIESLYPNQLERHFEFLAHHYDLSDAPEKAAWYLERSAEKQERLFANEALVDTSNRLLEVIERRLPRSSEYARMRTEALIRLGRVLKLLGRNDEAAKAYRRAIRGADRLDEGRDLAALARRNLADVERLRGRIAQALRLLKRAVQIWDGMGDDARSLTGHNSMGVILMSQGDYAEAAREFEKGVEKARAAGTREALANVLNDLGIARMQSCAAEEALEAFREALGLMEELADRKGMTATLNNIGMCCERLGRFDDALNQYGRAFELAQKIGHHTAVLGALVNIGQCYQFQGDRQSAMRNFRRVLRLAKDRPNPFIESVAHGNLAVTLVAAGQNGKVDRHLREARRLARTSRNFVAQINADLAEVAFRIESGKTVRAIALIEKAIDQIREHDYRDSLSPAYRYLAEALLGKGDLDEARRAAAAAVRQAGENGNPRDKAWALWVQARIERARNRKRRADSLVEQARNLAAEMGDLGLQEAMGEGQFE